MKDRIGQELSEITALLRRMESKLEEHGEFVGGCVEEHSDKEFEIRLNRPGAVFFARLILDVAESAADGAHVHIDDSNLFDDDSIRLIISKFAQR